MQLHHYAIAAMKDYQHKLGGLADKLKKEPVSLPIQEVHPVKQELVHKEEEAQLNTWIPKGLLKRMKSFGIERELSLKDINIRALQFFMDAQEKK